MHSANLSLNLPTEKRYLILAANPCAFSFVSTLLSLNVSKDNITIVLDIQHPLDSPASLNCSYIVPRDFNALLNILSTSNCNVCCVFGWYAILPQDFINRFSGLIFNMHFGSLPLYRGAGGFSWQILHDQKVLCAHIHQLEYKVDAGPIILSTCASLITSYPTPEDFHELSAYLARSVAVSFGRILSTEGNLSLVEQDESQALYFPRLNTLRDGCLDLSWKFQDIERFIRAFSHPYPGAWFKYKNRVFHCHKCSLITNFDFHQFSVGLIVNMIDDGIFVSCSDSVIFISNIYDSNSLPSDISNFRIGSRIN